MLFNSWIFPVFFLVVWLLYWRLEHRRQNVLLLIASYVFYGWWDWRFLSLLMISTIVDYSCSQWMVRLPSHKKKFLLISMFANLGMLGFFKYFNFFADSAQRLLATLGFEGDFFTLSIILPVGISFYTFQTMAYTIDVYRGNEIPEKNLLNFALYVSFFPQLVAGPIERPGNLLPKLSSPRTLEKGAVVTALELILLGYFKKVFIADGVAPMVDSCFRDPTEYGGLALVVGSYLFALQIYGDFSGYTDIARGVSRLLGIDLCLNFRQPYLSRNITEFWRRWHISLSFWLRDYLYISLGGNRKGKARTYVNLMLTMLLGGLWHGAGWPFVVWGGLHGAFLSIHKWMLGGKKAWFSNTENIVRNPAGFAVKVFLTFNLVCFTWIFFRSRTMADVGAYFSAMWANPPLMSLTGPLAHLCFYGFFVVIIDLLCYWKDAQTPFEYRLPVFLREGAYASALLLLMTIGHNNAQPFIYFQF